MSHVTQLSIAHFTDARINEIGAGGALTAEERSFLIEDTPRFEECSRTVEELTAMSDLDLLTTAYWVWADFCR